MPSVVVTVPEMLPLPPFLISNFIDLIGPSSVFPSLSFVMISISYPPVLLNQSIAAADPFLMPLSSKSRKPRGIVFARVVPVLPFVHAASNTPAEVRVQPEPSSTDTVSVTFFV